MTSILDCPTPVHLGSSDSLASPPGNPVSPAALREQYQRPERGVGPSTLPLMGTVPSHPSHHLMSLPTQQLLRSQPRRVRQRIGLPGSGCDICMYACMHVCICTYIYIYLFIEHICIH